MSESSELRKALETIRRFRRIDRLDEFQCVDGGFVYRGVVREDAEALAGAVAAVARLKWHHEAEHRVETEVDKIVAIDFSRRVRGGATITPAGSLTYYVPAIIVIIGEDLLLDGKIVFDGYGQPRGVQGRLSYCLF